MWLFPNQMHVLVSLILKLIIAISYNCTYPSDVSIKHFLLRLLHASYPISHHKTFIHYDILRQSDLSLCSKTYFPFPVSGSHCEYLSSLRICLPFGAFGRVVPCFSAPKTNDLTPIFLCRNWVLLGIHTAFIISILVFLG